MDGGHGRRGRVIAQEQDLGVGGTSQGKEDHSIMRSKERARKE